MMKEEFFAVGGTDQHLKDPEFNVMEFMTNFSEEDEFGIELLDVSPEMKQQFDELIAFVEKRTGLSYSEYPKFYRFSQTSPNNRTHRLGYH